MQLIRLFFVSLIAATFVNSVMAEDVKPAPREALETAVPEAIRLLEAKEYETFVKDFVAPADLKKITEKISLEDFAKTFGERKASRLLEVLKATKDVKPSLEENGMQATFELKKEIGGKKSITFVKVEKYWYVKN